MIFKVTFIGVEILLRLGKSKIVYSDSEAELIFSNHLVFSSIADIYAIIYAIQARDRLSRLLVRGFPNVNRHSLVISFHPSSFILTDRQTFC